MKSLSYYIINKESAHIKLTRNTQNNSQKSTVLMHIEHSYKSYII